MNYAFAPQRPSGHPIRNHVRHHRVARLRREENSDLKLFVLSFTAFFVCIYSLIF